MALSEVIKTALDQIQYIAKTETIIGDPIKSGDVTLIPVSRISVGFAAGGGGKEASYGSGTGTGGGINVLPVAFISIVGDKVEVHSIDQNEPSFSKVISMAPEVLKHVTKFFKKKDEVKSEN